MPQNPFVVSLDDLLPEPRQASGGPLVVSLDEIDQAPLPMPLGASLDTPPAPPRKTPLPMPAGARLDVEPSYPESGQRRIGPRPRGVADIADNAIRSLGAGVPRLEAGLWGVLRAAGDTLGMSSLSEFAAARSKGAERFAEEVRGPQAGAGPKEKAAYSGLESMGMALPGLAIGAATGPAIPLALMGGATGGESYQEAREQGAAPMNALLYSAGQGAIEVVTEMIPVAKLLGDLEKGTGFGKMVLGQLASEIPGEQLATLLQDLNSWANLPENKDKPFADYVAERPSAAADTLIATVTGTLGQTVTLETANRVAGALQERQQRRPGRRATPAPEAAPAPAPAPPAPAPAPIVDTPLPTPPAAPPAPVTARDTATMADVSTWGDALTVDLDDLSPASGMETPPPAAAAAPVPAIPEGATAVPLEDIEPKRYKFSSTQVNLTGQPAALMQGLSAQIPDEDLAPEHGRETEPHITVKYGLHTEDVDDVRKVLADEEPVTVTFGKTAHFADVEDGTADAVLVEIRSTDLRRLNKKIADALEHTDTHPDYKPHATIAYVKPGLGQKYDGLDTLEGQKITLNEIVFSGKDGQKIAIPLGRPAAAAQEGVGSEPTAETTPGEPSASLPAPTVAQEQAAPAVRANIRRNTDLNSIEIAFPERPAPEVLARLKAAGYRWAKGNKVWYRRLRTASETLESAEQRARELVGVTEAQPAQAPQPAAEAPPRQGPTPQVEALPGTAVRLPSFATQQQRKPIERDPQGRVISDGPPAPKPAPQKPASEMTDDEITAAIMARLEAEAGEQAAPVATDPQEPTVKVDDVAWDSRGKWTVTAISPDGKHVTVEAPARDNRRPERWTVESFRETQRGPRVTFKTARIIPTREGVKAVPIGPEVSAIESMGAAADRYQSGESVIYKGESYTVASPPKAGDRLRITRGEGITMEVDARKLEAAADLAGPAPSRPAAKDRDADLDARRKANKATRDALAKQLAKDLGLELNTGVNPQHVKAMVGILRTYVDDGVVEFERAWRTFKAEYGKLAPLVERPFEIAWEMFRGETKRIADLDAPVAKPAEPAQTTAQEATGDDENGAVAGDQESAAEPDRPGGGRRPARVRGTRTAADSGRDAGGRGEGDRAAGDVSDGRDRPVRGRREVRPDEVTPATAPDLYRITDADQVGTGSPSQRVARNLAAIRVVKTLESEQRPATPEERAILVKYVGWGGLPRVFEYWKRVEGDDTPDDLWYKADQQLKDLLTKEEYAAARNSTQNAHYTSPTVIKGMWDAVVHLLGPTRGSLLEPSAGIGHFVGLSPDLVRGMPWAMVEKDAISAAIAKALYPGAFVQHSGFEAAALPDDHFTAAVSNVPFGRIPITDEKFTGPAFVKQRIHNYFFAKALDKVAPGGLVAFITTQGTLDSRGNARVREYLAGRADFLGAIRLPYTAFKANAGTEVVTDIIFLRKRHAGEQPNHAGPWLETVPVELPNKDGVLVEQHVNEYMLANPRMVLGRHTSTGKMRKGDSYNVEPTGDLAEQLQDAIRTLPTRIIDTKPPKTSLKAFEQAQAPIGSRPFEYLIHEGRLAQVIDGKAEPADVSKADEDRIRGLLPVRAALRDVYDRMTEDADDAAVTKAQKALTRAYDAFVKKHGPISASANFAAFREDPDLPLLLSLEEYDEESNTAKKTAIFTTRTVRAERRARRSESPHAALLTTLGETGTINLDRIGELLNIGPEQAAQQLEEAGHIINTPSGWQLPAVYLSGNVRVKLAEAEAAAALNPAYQRAVERLKAVIPEDLPAYKINVRLGASWIPVEKVQKFIASIAGGASKWTLTYTRHDAKWDIEGSPSAHSSRFETPDVSTKDLLLDALNDRRRTIKRKDSEGRTYIDQQATALARQRKEDIHKAFHAWLFKDDIPRRDWAVRVYNDLFNAHVEPQIDGSFLTFPGLADFWRERMADHQRNAVARALLTGNTLLAHVVGAGKTLTMVATAMEFKRLGIARKPMFVVPNHLISQVPSEFLQHYPNARVLVATPEDLSADKRKRFTARVAAGDYDAVIMPYSAFVRVSMSAQAETEYQQGILDEIEAAIIAEYQKAMEDERGSGVRGGSRGRGGKTPPSVKRLENMRDRIKKRLEQIAARPKDDMLDFEQLGVDALFVDEAHSFKNLYFPTRQQAAGIPADNDAQRALDLYLKVRHINRLSNYRNVVLATGTPVSNSMAEIFVMQKLLQEHLLERANIASFDAWLQQFGHIIAETELDPSGTGMSARPRLKAFRNLPDLAAMFRQVADVKMIDDLPWLKARRPKLKGGQPEAIRVPLTAGQSALLSELKFRADHLDPKDRKTDNMVKITGDGRLGMLDMRLLDRRNKDEKGSKMHVAAEQITSIYKEWRGKKGTQIVFLDAGTPGSEERSARMRDDRDAQGNKIKRPPTEAERNRGFDLYADLKKKLVKGGIPEDQIAFIHDIDKLPEKKRDGARKALFRKVREGEIRVLVGSTGKMGTGMNVQDRLVALHNIDPAWKPSDIEQRNGRILRQGNLFAREDPNFEVRILNYVATGQGQQFGFDAYMWQLNEAKAGIISRFFAGNLQDRDMSLDLEQTVLTASEMKAIATGNPLVLELAKAEAEVARLESVYAGWEESHREAEYNVGLYRGLASDDAARVERNKKTAELITARENADEVTAKIGGATIIGHTQIGEAILAEAHKLATKKNDTPAYWPSYSEPKKIGTFRGLEMSLEPNGTDRPWVVLRHPDDKPGRYNTGAGDTTHASVRIDLLVADDKGPGGLAWANPTGLVTRMHNRLDNIVGDTRVSEMYAGRLRAYEAILSAPFEQQADLDAARQKVERIATELGVRTGRQEEVEEIDGGDEDASTVAAGPAAEPEPEADPTIVERIDAAEQAAKDRIRKRGTFRGGRLSAGVPVDDVTDLVVIGAAKIAKGVIRFSEWSGEMVREFGQAIEPHLHDIYAKAVLQAEEFGPRPVRAKTDRPIPPAGPIPEGRALEFPSIEKMPEAIQGDVAALLEQYAGFETQRRGVQSWERTQEMAKDVWLPLETLRPGTALNAEELEAYKTAIATVLTQRKPLLEKIADGSATDADKARASYLTDAATVLTASYRGAKAEAGRALNILRAKGRVLELRESKFLESLINAPGFQADVAALSREALEAAGDPLKQLQLLRQRAATLYDYVQALFYANLLSGIKTHVRNIIGNSANILANMATPLGAVPIDVMRHGRGRGRTVFLGEIPQAFRGSLIGFHLGMKNAYFTFKEGFRPSAVEAAGEGRFDSPRVELPGGLANPLNYPSRALEAADEFFRAIAYSQELYAGAYAQAVKEEAADIPERMAEILSAAPDTKDGRIHRRIATAAEKYAARAVFQEDAGPLLNWLLQVKSSRMPAPIRAAVTFVVPFMKTPANILRQGFEWSPAGFIMRGAPSAVIKRHRGAGREGAQYLGRAALGSAFLLGPIAWLAASGMLTGAPPDDPGEKEEFFAQGKMANAVRIGQYWVRYALFQPYSVMMAAVSNAWQVFQHSEQDEAAAEEAFASALVGGVASIFDQSFLSGLGTLQDAIQDPQRYGGRWLTRSVQGLVPFSGLLRNITQAVDGTVRRPSGIKEGVQAVIPGASDELLPLRDRFGEEVRAQGGPIQRGFVVPEVSKVRDDRLTAELAAVGYRPQRPTTDLRYRGEPVPLTDQQKDVLLEARGRERKFTLERVMGRANWSLLEDEQKKALFEQAAANATRDVTRRAIRTWQRQEDFTLERLISAGLAEQLREDARVAR